MLATMMQTMDNKKQDHRFLNGRILIVGLGATGLSVARFLAKHGANEIAITDSREHPPGLDELQMELPDIAVFVSGFEPDAFMRADTLIVSPGVSIREPLIIEARARGVEVLGDIEVFARFVNSPVVAITGSNGKSTVTTLVADMARQAGIRTAMGGNIGTPALDLLSEDTELYVLELSSFQLESTENLDAGAAVILNISEDHMDRYDNLRDYISAKIRIFHGNGGLIVNRDDEVVMATEALIERGRKVLSFGLNKPDVDDFGLCAQEGVTWLCRGEERLIPEAELRIKGRHNTANALAALALGTTMEIPMTAMLAVLRRFPGLPHRCQWVRERNEVVWFNDSKATNVGAALAAIEGIPAKKTVLIAGGQAKGQDFNPLKAAVKEHCRCVVLLGEDAGILAELLKDTVPLFHVGGMEEAVQRADEKAHPGDAVLLSPACASFDMFTGFADRGDAFIKAVEDLD